MSAGKPWRFHTDGNRPRHVWPEADLFEHELDDEGDCACGPHIEPVQAEDGSFGEIIVHNSLDAREKTEGGVL